MAYRRTGHARGGYGQSAASFAKQEMYEIFPEIKKYPDVNLKQEEEELTRFASWAMALQKFWNASPYYLKTLGQGSESNVPLSDYVKMTEEYVPAELVSRKIRRSSKKVRWDSQSDLQRLDFFEKLDQGPHGEDDGEKEKKEDGDDDEDDENIEEEEDDSGDDYDQNLDFDDDEDDFNMNDDLGDDEGYY